MSITPHGIALLTLVKLATTTTGIDGLHVILELDICIGWSVIISTTHFNAHTGAPDASSDESDEEERRPRGQPCTAGLETWCEYCSSMS